MSLLDKENFCKGSITGTVEDIENGISINFEVFIPKQEYAHSDDEFEIYLDGIQDSDYNGEWTDNLEEAIYNSCFLETICDYAFASRTRENIYTDCSCKIYIESSTLEWDEKASENDAYFTAINTYGYDGMYKLLTKEEKFKEIEEISEEIAELFNDDIISYQNFASHIIDAIEQNFVSDDDINAFNTDDIIKESAKWFELYFNHSTLYELKMDIMMALDIQFDGVKEQMTEDIILNCFGDVNDNIIAEEINNFDIDFQTAVNIISKIIDNKYAEEHTIDDW